MTVVVGFRTPDAIVLAADARTNADIRTPAGRDVSYVLTDAAIKAFRIFGGYALAFLGANTIIDPAYYGFTVEEARGHERLTDLVDMVEARTPAAVDPLGTLALIDGQYVPVFPLSRPVHEVMTAAALAGEPIPGGEFERFQSWAVQTFGAKLAEDLALRRAAPQLFGGRGGMAATIVLAGADGDGSLRLRSIDVKEEGEGVAFDPPRDLDATPGARLWGSGAKHAQPYIKAALDGRSEWEVRDAVEVVADAIARAIPQNPTIGGAPRLLVIDRAGVHGPIIVPR